MSVKDNMSSKEYDELVIRLKERQNNNCFICAEILGDTCKTHIDHIKPRSTGGKDDENNYAITHDFCNTSKQDTDLEIARRLHILKKIQKDIAEEAVSLEHVLKHFNGSSDILNFKIDKENRVFKTSIDDIHEKEYTIFEDEISDENSVILEIPIKYLYFDKYINPRPINITNIGKLTKEFYKKNPQLHLVLARIDYDDSKKIKIFDGQHKAVSRLLLYNSELKSILIRLFINENNTDRLIETNKKAGKELAQVAFSANIVRQLQNTILREKINQYLETTKKSEDDKFSEHDLLEHFKGYKNFKSLIIDSARDMITHSKENKLKDYMIMEGKVKELPISYSTFSKSILTLMHVNYICEEDYNDEENKRLLEINQMIKFCNIITEVVLQGKFDENISVVTQLENKLTKGQADSISDNHIIACRLMKEEIFMSIIEYIKHNVIKGTLAINRVKYDDKGLFLSKFPDVLWANIENAIKNVSSIALWKNRELSETIFTGKKNKKYWTDILETGKTSEGMSLLNSKSLLDDLFN